MNEQSLRGLTKAIVLRNLRPLYRPVTDWLKQVARAWQLTTYVLFITFIVMSHTETGTVTVRNILGAALISPVAAAAVVYASAYFLWNTVNTLRRFPGPWRHTQPPSEDPPTAQSPGDNPH